MKSILPHREGANKKMNGLLQENCKVRRKKKAFATEIKEDTENPLFSVLCVLRDLCG